VDCTQYLTLDTYVSAGEDGNICLWKETQKKPMATMQLAHGMNGSAPYWITSMASLKISDLFATGSSSGDLNFWTATGEKNSLERVNQWRIGPGFINGIALSSRFVVLGVGSEHRLGRWERIKSVKNRIEVIRLPEELSGGAVRDSGVHSEEEEESSSESEDDGS
jgi:ribosomal RNA-processing protein 9